MKMAVQGHRRAHPLVEAAMNAPRRPALPKWKIEVVERMRPNAQDAIIIWSVPS